MAAQSLFEDCQTLIEKGHEKWTSYFSKWEYFAKYEEDLPESEMFNTPEKKSKFSEKKKVKQKPVQKKSKVPPTVKYKKNQISRKKLLRRKRKASDNKERVKAAEECNDLSNENIIEDMGTTQLEKILKTAFTEILKANKNEFQMFTILSLTISNSSQLFNQRLACTVSTPMRSICNPRYITDVSSICQHKSNCIENLNRRCSFEFQMKPDVRIREQTDHFSLSDTFPKFKMHQSKLNESQFLIGSPTLRQTMQLNFGIKNGDPTFSNRLRYPSTELKSLEWDSSLKSPNGVYGKINNEYCIKRSFLKMSITQDGKRFGDLCLRKRTNSVTLSMENSNFITPERKPPERKCFSENVLQRKRTYPSKLFFGNEDEDSESDDETGKQTPIIHCRKKLKTQVISEVAKSYESDDDCESIFDRVSVC